ncbi:DUF4279 domain-containing protein [Ornithinibacillus xuwenensis]|uniref:DUF4279 domain-containing protein n=1 Tax=Ornithinibacillus xuwenensis TaxID=3144668 RepID=A0ABU9XI95_9BACI
MPNHKGNMEAHGVTIPYIWMDRTEKSTKLVILLPSKAYTTQGPLFWYTNHIYWNEGFDSLQLLYTSQDIDEEKLPVIVNEMIITFLQQHEYETIHFVSMGLGSTVAAYFLTHQVYPNIQAVWFSPDINHSNVLQALLNRPNKGLVLFGDSGDLIQEEGAQLVEEKEHLIVAHVNGGDLLEDIYPELNIDTMRSIVQIVQQFIQTGVIELIEKKTEIQVYICLYGDDFPLEEVTEKLGIEPTNTVKKGDEIIPPNGKINPDFRRYYTQTSWELETGYQENVDLEDVMNQIVGKLRSKIFVINELRKKYDLTSHIQVVLHVENGQMPILTLNKKLISFAHQIQTEYIDFDCYVMPFDENLRFENDGINFKGRKL